eukprot:GEMP01092570.1.p1 GENE.GEMP01092570.1~~GEMP01092570.1.p1  ORF type:complete len:134 (+),score=18.43 GEMP01092570.1:198-599(+)
MTLLCLFAFILLVLAKQPFQKRKAVTLHHVNANHQLIVKFNDKNLKSPLERARACGELSLKDGVRSVDILNGVQMCVVETDTLLTRASLKAELVGDVKVEDVAVRRGLFTLFNDIVYYFCTRVCSIHINILYG